jgi:hypothetical protein
MDIDEHDATLRARAARSALPRLGTAWTWGDDDLCRRSAPPAIDRTDGHRRADGRRDVSGLGASIPVPNAPTGRHRDPRQPQQSQGDGSRESDPRYRSSPTLSASVLSGSEPDRKVLFQTQGAAPQSRLARHRRPMEGNRSIAQYGLLKRMHKLLRLLWICKHLNRNRSN